jgi:hypothetical protein
MNVLAAMSEHTWWWLARATGMVAWALSVAAIVWGLTLSGRVVRRKRLPAWLLDLHKYLGTLTLGFVAVHMAALTLDSYVAFDAKDLFVPMASSWKSGAVAWGIAAFYVLVIIQVTSWGMKWLPRKVWHGIHFSSFFVFVAATIHGITAGTDAAEPLVQMGALVGTTLLLTLVFLRVINSMNAVDDASGGAKAAAAKARAARAEAPTETALLAAATAPDVGTVETVLETVPETAPETVPETAPAVDPVLAARLAKLGDRVGRTPRSAPTPEPANLRFAPTPEPATAGTTAFLPGSAPVVHAGGAQEQRHDALVTYAGVDHFGDEHGVVAPAHGVGDPALEPVGQVDEQGSAGLWASLEAEAVERVPLDHSRAEEGLPYIKLLFPQYVDGEGAGPLDDGVGVAVGLDADHDEGWLERGL